jgi:transposase
VAERVWVREISNQEGNRLLRIVRRSTGSVVTWRRAQMVLLSAQGMDVAQIAQVTFASPDRVRDVLHNFNLDGFDSLYPRYRGGRPPTFTLAQRRRIKQLALSRPQDHDLPFSTWSLAKLADFLVAEGVVDDISHEGLRVLLRQEQVSFQRLKTWKQSRDPDFEAKKNRILHLYGLMDGTSDVQPGDPEVVICIDEFGPSTCNPTPAGNGPPAPAVARDLAAGGALPTPAHTACGTCWPPTTSPATGSMGTSSRASAVGSSWCSCAMCGRCTRPGCGWGWCWTTTAHICRPVTTPGSANGHRPQRRAGLRADQCLLAEPHRGAVHRAALLRLGRHRPLQPYRAGQHDPPLYRLAEPQCPRPPPRPNRQQGKRCLTRH